MISIIIVNYKTPQLLLDVLATIYYPAMDIDFEVIVVDNASGDNSRQLTAARFPDVRWIQLDYNAGFARANNAGIREANGDAVLLLNSDTLVEDRAIERCFLTFMTSPYAACGVQLLNPDRTPQISGNYFMKGSLNNLLPLPYIGHVLTWLGNTVKVKKPNVPDAQTEIEVDWINGAFLMVKKSAIDQAGLLDEDFFLYAEEAEWCSRLRKAGKLCIYGQYKVIHLQGATANDTFGSSGKGYHNLSDKKGLQIMLSNFVRIRKHLGIAWFFFHLLAYTFAAPAIFIVSFLEGIIRLKNPFAKWPQAIGFTGNVLSLWRFMPHIVRNAPYFYKVL